MYASIDFSDPALTATDIHVEGDGTGNALGAAFSSGPTTVDLGMVPVGAMSEKMPVVKPGDPLLSFVLKPIGGQGKQTSSAATPVSARARNLSLVQADGNWALSWDYTNPGDSNQDGEVGINDLKPIGEHFRETLTSLQNSPLRHIDADANGEINLGDISSIGSNMRASLYAYNIEMSQDGMEPFDTVGQLLLDEERQSAAAGETLRFSYGFVGQYVPHAWYRVTPIVNNPAGGVLQGTPSEAVSEDGRQLMGVAVEVGIKKTIAVSALGLDAPLSHLNSCRVIFPSGYKYVPNSFNPGSLGGTRDTVDGIWANYATAFFLPTESMLEPVTLEDGQQAIDFNVTVPMHQLSAAPVGYGDLFNFQLEKVSGGALDLAFAAGDPNGGVKRTYYSTALNENGETEEHFFGNTIGFRVN
jgi:hypothetical protein